MNNMRDHVIGLVQNTVLRYSSTENPNLDEICAGLGLDVKEAVLPHRIDGMLEGKRILINSRMSSKERKRFTQAHEVMHHLFNEDGELISALHDLIHDVTYNQNGEYDRQLEKFCNIGAAEFLMPSRVFIKLCEEKGFNIELVLYAARYFKSSTIATTIQLAQVAPYSCITAICERGLIPHRKVYHINLFGGENISSKPRLHVVYSAPSLATKYWLAKYTEIPGDHLINQASLQDQLVEGESYVPFRSGRKMPCRCEALVDGDRVYVLFHLSTPPTPVDPNQRTLF